jgi:endonuclease/exonuclease/phosphatase family metal-dependent hydrolase
MNSLTKSISAATLSCISWNIHRGRGNDGRVDPARTLDVLAREVWRPGTDAIFLQEADAEAAPHHGVLDVAGVEAVTGLRHLHGPAGTRLSLQSHGFLGVVVYLHPALEVDMIRLVDLPGYAARGAVVADVRRAGRKMRFVVTHLSLGQALRVMQMRTIAQLLDRLDDRQVILCGDLNEWRPWGGLALSRQVLGRSFTGPVRRTFPVRQPLLPLDRVLTTSPGLVEDVAVLDGPGIRLASDHRPLWARLRLGS